MSGFPTTSHTLIQKLAVDATGGNDAAWVRFFDLYTPAMKRFVQLIDHNHDPDDVVQEVYIHLVKILEERRYKAEKAQFSTFLKMLIRRQLIGMYRHERAHGAGEIAVSCIWSPLKSRERNPVAETPEPGSGIGDPASGSILMMSPSTVCMNAKRAQMATIVPSALTRCVKRPWLLKIPNSLGVAAESGIIGAVDGGTAGRVTLIPPSPAGMT